MSPKKQSPAGPIQSPDGVSEKRKKSRPSKRPVGQKSHVSKTALAWAAERDRKTLCACGCGRLIRVKWFHYSRRRVPQFIRGHWRRGKETAAAKWIRENRGKHFCQCGCNGAIPIQLHHHVRGVPRFLNHHAIRVISPTRGQCGPASRSYKGGRNKTPTGYINILVGSEGGRPIYALEHRLVMEKALGRKLRKGESVHHKNGQRDDNRLSNLELWRSNHPGGQRVQDTLSFAVSVIRDHAGDTSAWPESETQLLRRIAEALKQHELQSESRPPEGAHA
jgi:hypothetical protein